MKNRTLTKTITAIFFIFAFAFIAMAQDSTKPLTEDIVKQVITDNYFTQYKKEYPGVEVEFGPIRIAPKKKKFGVINKNEETTVNPVKVAVTIKVTRSDGSTFESKRGDKPDEVFLFYQNEFGDWSFRVGSSGN